MSDFQIAAVVIIAGALFVMVVAARALRRIPPKGSYRTNHGRDLPPRSPSREKRGW